MLSIASGQHRFCDGVSRRAFLRIGTLGLGELSLPGLLQAEGSGGRQRHKAVIMVYLPGGPTQLDMVDLKMDVAPCLAPLISFAPTSIKSD